MRTLAVHTGALGDFLLACPALTRLAADGPLVLAGHPERHALAVAAGIAERAFPLDALALHEVLAATGGACGGASRLPSRFQAAVAGFDRAVVWMRDPGGVLTRAFAATGVADARCLPGLPHAAWGSHAADYYLDSIGALPARGFTLNLSPAPGLDTVFAPGSGNTAKNWPLGHFLALAKALEGRGHRITWLLGPAEEHIGLPSDAKLLRTPNLVELGRQLTAARLFVGNDSGPTHLAALTGCPTLAIFGPTDPAMWHPLGPRASTLRGTPWPSVQEVLACCTDLAKNAV